MVNPQLLQYIKQQLQQGMSQEQIKSTCISSGWQAKDIQEAFSFALGAEKPPVTQVPKKGFSIWKIIGIVLGTPIVLVIIIVPLQTTSTKESRDSTRVAYIKSLQLYLSIYSEEHQGTFPASLDELYAATLRDPSPPIDPVTKQPKHGGTLQMGTMPLDPITKKTYEYQQLDNGKNFKLCVQFESLKEKSCVSDGVRLIGPNFPNRGSGF